MATIIQDPLRQLETILFQLFTIVFKALKTMCLYYPRSTETTRSNIASINQDCIKSTRNNMATIIQDLLNQLEALSFQYFKIVFK